MAKVEPNVIAARFALPEPGHQSIAAPAGQTSNAYRYFAALVAILGSLTFNFMLTFVNTRIFSVNDKLVILSEMMLVGLAFLAAADRRSGLYIAMGLLISYMVFLFALRGVVDPKPVRDALIPIVFVALGSRLADMRFANLLVTVALAVVLSVALLEYLASDMYLDYFNVLGYYIAKGSVSLEEAFGQTKGFFISGIRPEPRTILPFLGQHRVSSVFLEPVSAGNFGAIAFSWALYSKAMRGRFFIMAGALMAVALADARFGLLTCMLVTVAYPFYNLIARQIWLVLPFLALALLATYGIASGTEGGDNGVLGRIAVTAALLSHLSPGVALGATATDQFVADSGLAYSLVQFGLFGFIALWAAFVFLPSRSARAWKYHSMVMIYFLLLLLISNSGYSIKTGALLWFLLGTALAAKEDEGELPPATSGIVQPVAQ